MSYSKLVREPGPGPGTVVRWYPDPLSVLCLHSKLLYTWTVSSIMAEMRSVSVIHSTNNS